MLLQFNFKNFRSFRDDTTLDLTAAKISERSEHIVTIGNERILPVAAIFGANASGKTNVINAFNYMAYYVSTSFAFGGNDNKADKPEFAPPPFLFDAASQGSESSFEVYFIDSQANGAKTFNYGFVVNKSGVSEEWLNYRSKSARGEFKRIFYRKGDSLDLSGIAVKSQENIKIALEKETLVVSLGAKLKIDKLKAIRDWFAGNEIADFGTPIIDAFFSHILPANFEDAAIQKNVLEYIAAFDPSIVGFEVIKDATEDGKHVYQKVFARHKVIGSELTALLPLHEESAGTLKMFSLYPFYQRVMESGGVLFADELNAKLHPLLVRAFVLAFLDPSINKNHAQLVFTTHDAWQLDSNLLRRDEVWFTDKSADGVSSLYSLVDFSDESGAKIRKDENYAKNYLLGKYGAIPLVRNFDMVLGE